MNNAAYSKRAPLLEMDASMLERTLDVILVGTFHASQLAARQMVKQGSGGSDRDDQFRPCGTRISYGQRLQRG